MGFLRRIENRLEGVFEGGIGRTFRSNVQPVELARKLTKEMDDNKVISVSQVYVPNVYTVFLAPDDRDQFFSYEARLRTELAGYLTEHARREGFSLPGRARVLIETAEELEVGSFGIAAQMEETPSPSARARPPAEFTPDAPPVAAPALADQAAFEADDSMEEYFGGSPEPARVSAPVADWAVVWSGGVCPIGATPVVIGRSQDCDVPLSDGNASRRHAELGRSDEGFVLRDLDSTNGTMVNGRRIRSATIGTGDEITIGTSTLRIERRHG